MDLNKKDKNKTQTISIDEALTIVGEYGRFQIIVNAIFCLMALPPVFQIMMMFFAADAPDWRCAANSTVCTSNKTSFSPKDKFRCGLKREDWEYVYPRDYSLVTQFDIYCSNNWILEINVSVFFLGWIIGAVLLGWVSDTYGRKIVIFVSIAAIMVSGFASCFMPSVFAIIFFRFIIGVFTPGTYQQSIMIMTEIVGPKYRAFAGNIIFVFVTSSMAILGLKAYFIREWKTLFLVCTAPYLFVFLFWSFIPESLRSLSIQGKTKELQSTINRIAKFNGRPLPPNVVVRMDAAPTNHKSNPLDLFKERKMAKKTFCQTLGYIVGGMTFYGLYLAAKDIGGSMYRDYTIVTMSEIPFALAAVPLCDRLGRKKTCLFFYAIGTLSCIGLCFAPEHGQAKISRILLGMLGKCSVGAGYNSLQTWTVELYPTHLRGEAMGFLQVLTRLGAALAPVVNVEISKLNKFAPYIFFGAITLVSMLFLPPLKETKDANMGDAGVEEEDKPVDYKEEVEFKENINAICYDENIHTNAASNELYDEFNPKDGNEKPPDNEDKEERPLSTYEVMQSYTNCIDMSDETQSNASEQNGRRYTINDHPNV